MVKYKLETYTANKSYSSHCNLSVEESKGIEATNYNNLPSVLKTELDSVEIYNDYSEFVPPIDVYEGKGHWTHSKKTDWYTHVKTGIKVKLEHLKTPDYDKPNGNGECTIILTVKIPQPSERGKNPNSHNNRAIPGLVSKDVRLTEEQWQKVEVLGNGRGYSQGVRNLLNRVEQLETV